MEAVDDRLSQVLHARLDSEMALIRAAIAMVAGGDATRVLVAGIGFGEAVLVPARRLALEAGVRLRLLQRSDDRGADAVIERIRR